MKRTQRRFQLPHLKSKFDNRRIEPLQPLIRTVYCGTQSAKSLQGRNLLIVHGRHSQCVAKKEKEKCAVYSIFDALVSNNGGLSIWGLCLLALAAEMPPTLMGRLMSCR
jgi:hypothetical protein